VAQKVANTLKTNNITEKRLQKIYQLIYISAINNPNIKTIATRIKPEHSFHLAGQNA